MTAQNKRLSGILLSVGGFITSATCCHAVFEWCGLGLKRFHYRWFVAIRDGFDN
jgi:hypothetical protein